MPNPFTFTDADGDEWVRNPDGGTYGCPNAMMLSATIEWVRDVFGPLSIDVHPLTGQEPLAEWERMLLDDEPEVGDQVRVTITATVMRKVEQPATQPLVGAGPTFYKIDTEPDGSGSCFTVFPMPYDQNVTMVVTKRKEA